MPSRASSEIDLEPLAEEVAKTTTAGSAQASQTTTTTTTPPPSAAAAAAQPSSNKRKAPNTTAVSASKPPTSKRVRIRTPGDISREWQRQYFQGVPASEFRGITSGDLVLGTAGHVPFQSPIQGEGVFEIIEGPNGPGSGAIRWHSKLDDAEYEDLLDLGFGRPSTDTFVFPFRHVEDIFIVDSRGETAKERWRVMIVPTKAVGSVPFKTGSGNQGWPEWATLSWPAATAEKNLRSLRGRAVATADRQLVKSQNAVQFLAMVLDEQLKPLGKKVYLDFNPTPTSESASPSLSLSMPAQLGYVTQTELQGKQMGKLHITSTGILFHSSKSKTIFVPFHIIHHLKVSVAHCWKKKKTVQGFEVLCTIKDPAPPFSRTQDEASTGESPAAPAEEDNSSISELEQYYTLVGFTKIELKHLLSFKAHLVEAASGVKVDYENDEREEEE